MSVTGKYKILDMSNQIRIIQCIKCKNKTNHKYISCLQYKDSSPEDDFHITYEYCTLQCNGCKEVKFVVVKTDSETYDSETGKPEEYFDEYPPYVEELNSMIDNAYCLPYDIRRIYEQTKETIANRQNILAAAGMRLILEGVVNDKSISGMNLQEKIENLSKYGYMPENGIPLLQRIRIFGNQAIHDLSQNEYTELLKAFSVIEYTLKSVYELTSEKSPLHVNLQTKKIFGASVVDDRSQHVEKIRKVALESINGGLLDSRVNPRVVEDLVTILLSIGESSLFHGWQKAKVIQSLETYLSETKIA